MIRLGSDKYPTKKFQQLLQPELPECAFSITLQDGGDNRKTVSNIPSLYICLCELTHVGQDKGAKPGWTRGDSMCERSTIPGWLEISTPPGSRFKSRTFLVVAKEVCGLFASLIILIGCVHWEREKLNIFLPGVVLGEVEIGACSLQRWVYQIITPSYSHDYEKVTKNSSQ